MRPAAQPTAPWQKRIFKRSLCQRAAAHSLQQRLLQVVIPKARLSASHRTHPFLNQTVANDQYPHPDGNNSAPSPWYPSTSRWCALKVAYPSLCPQSGTNANFGSLRKPTFTCLRNEYQLTKSVIVWHMVFPKSCGSAMLCTFHTYRVSRGQPSFSCCMRSRSCLCRPMRVFFSDTKARSTCVRSQGVAGCAISSSSFCTADVYPASCPSHHPSSASSTCKNW